MTPAERANTLKRHELRRVFGLLDGGRGWAMHAASNYIAQAVFRYGSLTGHVVGNIDGWWWAVQDRPGKVGPFTKAAGPREACLMARQAVRSESMRRQLERESHGD